MAEINASNFKKEHGDLAPDLVGVTELTSPYFFVPPSGNTAERPEDCEPGTLRFNTDVGSLEVFRGNTCLLYTSPSPRDATLSRMPSSA